MSDLSARLTAVLADLFGVDGEVGAGGMATAPLTQAREAYERFLRGR
jgi:hypothetical protein